MGNTHRDIGEFAVLVGDHAIWEYTKKHKQPPDNEETVRLVVDALLRAGQIEFSLKPDISPDGGIS